MSLPQNTVTERDSLKKVMFHDTTRLPSGYTELAYLYKARNVNCYINTGINQTNTVGMKVGVKFDSYTGNYQYIAGAYVSGEYIGVWKADSNTINLCFRTNISGYSSSDTTNFINIENNYCNSRVYKVNGIQAGSITETKTVTTPEIYIFNTNYNAASGFTGAFAISEVEITDGTEIVRHLIPAKNSDNVLGMYDIIEGEFLTPTVGTLTAGPVITPIVPVNCYKSVMFHRDSDESPLIMVETLKQSMFFD